MDGRKTLKSCLGRRNLFAVGVFLALLGLVGAANGRTITVDDDGLADFDNIQAAVDDANTGDIIEVQPGTYTGTGNRDIDFLGKAITVRSTDPNDPNVVDTTVIDCQAGYFNRHRGFKFHSGEGPDSVLSGITITGGYGPQEEYIDLPFHILASAGGGIFCDSSSPTITRCNIINNVAWGIPSVFPPPAGGGGVGGGICLWNSSATLDSCTINSNGALSIEEGISNSFGGGVFYSFGGGGVITNCTISDNSASGIGIWAVGGGIVANDCVISNCRISGNFSKQNGGGITAGNSTITNCVIMDNEANWRGGGLYNCTAPITNCIIWDNIASEGLQMYDSTEPTYSCIQDWTGGGSGNISVEPDLRTDGHLRAESPCINSGDPNYVPGPNETDIDGEERVHNGIIDIGIDEFIDTDGDGMPDWWEQKYFGSPTSANPSDDADGDGLDNLREYNIGFNPVVATASYYVDPQDGDDSWDGLAPVWDGTHGPKATIQAAIDIAGDYEKVILSPGTYKGGGNRDLDFMGKAITVQSTNPNDADVVATTVIDCNGTNSNRHRGFYFHSGEGPDSVIDGLTIINGYAPKEWIGDNRDYVGGAILCDGSSPTIKNCNITRNKSREYGGGICCYNSSPTIINCNISYNFTSWQGAGIYCYRSNPIIKNCDLTKNTTDEEMWGVIHLKGSSPIITNCNIFDNSTGTFYPSITGVFCDETEDHTPSSPTITGCSIISNDAGVICNYKTCIPSIINCTISDNRLWGGIRYCDGPITNCVITGNTSYDYGGGLKGCDGPISNCIISNNRGTYYGGGLSSCNGPITNCIITDNWVRYQGGGLYQCNGSITNCTIVNNKAQPWLYGDEGYGGGLYECTGSIANCVIRDNFADYGPQLQNCSEPNYSCIQDWSGGGEGNIDVEPYFAFSTDYHLMPGSACIDAGTNNPAGGLPASDKEGVYRPLDGDGDANAMADMGAYEYAPNNPTIAVSSLDSFYCIEGWENPELQTMQIRNSSVGTLHWEIIEDYNWLEAVPANGVSTGEIDEVTLMVDTNYLDAGSYFCSLEVLDMNAINSPVTIDVEVHVGALLRVPADYSTIQAAIDAAADSYDMVLVADGNYTGSGNKNLDFHGKVITVRSENGPNNCIIDCENSGYGFYLQSGETEESIVEGFTVTNGWTGIRCRNSSPTINNCIIVHSSFGIWCDRSQSTITNCTISNNEGGIFCEDSNPTINHSIIKDNLDVGRGGIRCWNGNLTITDSIVSNNAGGISCRGDVTIANCTISDNIGGDICGGIYCSGDATITNCTVTGNTSWWDGGGIGVRGEGAISNCIISNNTAFSGGGVYCGPRSNLTINKCKISNNISETGRGCGIYSRDSSVKISNSSITGNSVKFLWPTNSGGGIYCRGGDLTVTNCTLTGNSIQGSGGGVYGERCSQIISNTIIWANEANEGPQIYIGNNSEASLSYNDMQGGPNDVYVSSDSTLNWGGGNFDHDPCFVELGSGYWDDNNTPDMPWDDFWVWDEGDYHLLEGSPCIDAGDPNYIAGPNETDLDGNLRVVDGDNDGNSVVDMGAYEYRPPTPAELVAELLEDVGGLELPRGIENGLEAKLNAALRALEDENENNDIAAINTLGAFINAVEAQRGKKIPEAEADALIAAAQEIIEQLSTE